ncbi:hypothetical protein [Croceicoccus sp. YJ47]|uniref:hypothetical protein n=1 Tax=Croceicoccus sp. YJ47 TaxID=2798724 RepID=UPI001922EBA3|nr:hypothetical protein [Croceicoccus sp. YJ47]QQN73921.1 hypothetical protein JD971_14420 [Croceicoccus sp. YJ47]
MNDPLNPWLDFTKPINAEEAAMMAKRAKAEKRDERIFGAVIGLIIAACLIGLVAYLFSQPGVFS